MSVDKILRTTVSNETAEKILNRQISCIKIKYEYENGEIVEIINKKTHKSICKILIINKIKEGEKYKYEFLIYSTEEEEELLNKRLKALGYL